MTTRKISILNPEEGGSLVQDAIGHHAREQHAMGRGDEKEGVEGRAQETQSPRPVRVDRLQVEVEPRHAPKEFRPEQQAKIPPNQEELKYRQAGEHEPQAGQRELLPTLRGRGVPGARAHGYVLAPEDQDADAVDEGEHDGFRHGRVAQLQYVPFDFLEARHLFRPNQSAAPELGDEQAHATVDDGLGGDEQRHHHQKAQMAFHVLQERQGVVAPDQMTLQGRQNQQGRPGEQGEEKAPAAKQPKRVVRKVRSAQKLKERTAADEREVVLDRRRRIDAGIR